MGWMRLSGSDRFDCGCECQGEIVVSEVTGIMHVMAFVIWNGDGRRE